MRKRINVRISGLGGQGAVTSAHVLATAVYKEGRNAISNPFFGAEKRMAPAESYVRIADQKIYDRGEIVYPDIIMIYHPQVYTQGKCYTMPFYSGLKRGGLVIINTDHPLLSEEDTARLGELEAKLLYIDATQIAVDIAGTELATNMAMLGALVGATKIVKMESMEKALADRFGKKYVASGGTATLDEAIKKKFAKKEQLLQKNLETIVKGYEISSAWAESQSAMLV
ncbi:MAG: 2-oxoacid:acceptor oxidoreductase family protein [Nitrospirae bacterium]|nr:2-oxoacid:acceptor oxidoreductase family protein [Nitrospirota bacterium]MBI3353032.1 2-oxoacid:acceptor oxidoreductase family protein [Nitrospirota bacterium]